MSIRLWYPQLDVYDCIRRIALLLNNWSEHEPTTERVYVSDFFLANPPLLHRARMTQDVRKLFQGLQITKPEKAFISYPSPQMFFHKMEPIQKKAMQTIVGKGLLSEDRIRNGYVTQTDLGKRTFGEIIKTSQNKEEQKIAEFLAKNFALMDHNSITEFRKKTGLRRVT